MSAAIPVVDRRTHSIPSRRPDGLLVTVYHFSAPCPGQCSTVFEHAVSIFAVALIARDNHTSLFMAGGWELY